MAARLFTTLRERRNRNHCQRKKRTVSKKRFIALLEAALLCADLDITGLSLIDDNTVQITFKGGGRRRVNIEADSYGAVIVDVMKYVF